MLILANYAYHRPSSVEEAVKLLQEEGSVIMAGGSDVMPQLKTATIEPKSLVDLALIPELQAVEEKEDGIHIGAMAVLAQLAKNELILAKVPAIAQSARNVASPQIRNRGTVAGNFFQARRCIYYNQTKEWRQGIRRCFKVGGDVCLQIPNSPVCRAIYYSDVAPALLAYNAKAVVVNAEGEKLVSCDELMLAHCQDRDEQKMLVTEFIIPKESYTGWSGFMKYSLRGGIDFPSVNFACSYSESGVRVTAGAIATYVLDLTETAAYIREQKQAFEVSKALEIAVEEMKKKSQIVRESGISVQVKRGTFCFIEELLNALKQGIQ